MDDLFRKNYTPLTADQQAQMSDLKQNAETLLYRMNAAVPKDERSERSRCMAIARTHLETAVMFAVKAVTTSAQ